MASEPGVRTRTLRHPGRRAAVPLAALLLGAACSSGNATTGPPPPAAGPPAVSADGSSCRLSSDTVTAGDVSLAVHNTGASPVTVSVLAQGASAPPAAASVAVAAGSSGELRTTLEPGEYDVTCRTAGTTSSAPLSVDGEP